MIKKEPEFSRMQKLAYKTLLDYWKEGEFPIDSIKIAHRIEEKSKNLIVYTYQEICQKLGCSVEKLKEISDDGYTYCNSRGVVIIAYNDEIENKRRIQWTVAHELGHYISKNFLDEEVMYTLPNGKKKDIKEMEADYFSKNLLMPLPILCSLNEGANPISNPFDIQGISNLNFDPAVSVYEHLNKLTPYIIKKLPYKKELEELFSEELNFLKDENSIYENSYPLSNKIKKDFIYYDYSDDDFGWWVC